MQSFPAGNINNVGVRRSYHDGADRLRRLVIEDGIPGAAIVIGLPHSAVDLAYIKNIRLRGNAGGGSRAAAAKRTNHPPVQFLVSILGNLLRDAGTCQLRNQNTNEHTKDSVRSDHLPPSNPKSQTQ